MVKSLRRRRGRDRRRRLLRAAFGGAGRARPARLRWAVSAAGIAIVVGQHGFVLASDTGGRKGSGLHTALGGCGMPITAFYDADGRLLDVAGGALPEHALLERLRELYGAEV